MKSKTIFTALAASLLVMGVAGSAMAESQWDKDHPRRDQVNDRLANQNRRIHHEVKEGKMSRAKAARLHKDDRHVRREERMMASQDRGHITKQEQRALNQQENQVNRRIGQ